MVSVNHSQAGNEVYPLQPSFPLTRNRFVLVCPARGGGGGVLDSYRQSKGLVCFSVSHTTVLPKGRLVSLSLSGTCRKLSRSQLNEPMNKLIVNNEN